MPVIGIPVEELRSRLGREIDNDALLTLLGNIGCDVDGYAQLRRAQCARCGFVMELAGKEEVPPRCDRCSTELRDVAGAARELSPIDVIRMELLAVRPDLFDPAGLARGLRGLLSVETGLARYEVGPPQLRLRVDPSVRRESSLRPAIACAVLENVTLDDDRIKIVMKLQENLHWAIGRDRKHASIGVYDLDSLGSLDPVEGFHLEYTTEPPDFRFVPLGATAPAPAGLQSGHEILETHPKGMAYAHLLAGFDRYPILRTTAERRVLSMPPIINSEETKVHLGSRRFFIDVTGSGPRIVQRTLSILVTSLLEMDRAITARAVELVDEGGARQTPDLTPQRAVIDAERAGRLIGIPLDVPTLESLLLRMRHGVEKHDGTTVTVLVPAYRNDILHERDLMEDVAIAHGYDNIPRTLVPTLTVGREHPRELASEAAREVLLGLGAHEILNLVLTAPESSDELLGLPAHPATVLLDNPITSEQTQLRTGLLPGLLQTFARNRHHPLPQRIFEVGDVTYLDATAETGAREVRHLGLGVIAPHAGFAEARALAEAVVREWGMSLALRACEQPFLLSGRSAWILAPDGRRIGVFGEVHPETLTRLGLQNPAIVLELVVPVRGELESYRALPLDR
ncbi:MAG: phenylalanine--tRNA ligase subunit beta [Candidatus Eisenbacteria bacterium]|nr:phenylalanine--tRNA ligase subunit beta [Candidatus Eisenbacteria bacterium]